MAQFVPIGATLPAQAEDRKAFVVAQNARGYWVARERRGLIEGVFLSECEAIHFALLKMAAAIRRRPPTLPSRANSP